MRYRDFLIVRIKESWRSTFLVLMDHLRMEIPVVLVSALIGGFQSAHPLWFFGAAAMSGLATLGLIVAAVFFYQYARYPFLIAAAYGLPAKPALEILFSDGDIAFEKSDRHLKQFCIGIRNNSAQTTIEEVSVRLEKLQPPEESVPLLEFREMVYPFSTHYSNINNDRLSRLEPSRTVSINPSQTRYFEIVFMYQGVKSEAVELCFFPTNHFLFPSKHVLGLRATGRNVTSECAEFFVDVTEDGKLLFGRA